jgi:hypothetical protein
VAAEVKFAEILPEHIEFTALNMRKEDAIECFLLSEQSPREALVQSIELSEFSSTMLIEGQPASLFGVACLRRSILGDEPSIGVPWSLSTPVVDRFPREFYVASKVGVELLRDRFDILVNYVDANYHKSVRWLKRIGFEVGDPVLLGKARSPFQPFMWRRSWARLEQ